MLASTHYLRTLVPNSIQGMAFGIRDLKYSVLRPSEAVLQRAKCSFHGMKTLPQINMEAHSGPDIEDSSPIRDPLLFQVNLEECTAYSLFLCL